MKMIIQAQCFTLNFLKHCLLPNIKRKHRHYPNHNVKEKGGAAPNHCELHKFYVASSSNNVGLGTAWIYMSPGGGTQPAQAGEVEK